MNSIQDICKQYNIKNYTINPDGSIDVDGDVSLNYKNLTELPLRFNKVTGYFYCRFNQLTTLKGSPRWVGGSFYCNYNQLTILPILPVQELIMGIGKTSTIIPYTCLKYINDYLLDRQIDNYKIFISELSDSSIRKFRI